MSTADYYIKRALGCEFTSIAVKDDMGKVIGAAAYADKGDRLHIHYLGSKVRGTGSRLVAMLSILAQGRPLTVLSDCEAVGFYKRIGFRITCHCGAVVRMRKS